jgi:N-acetylgalactosamine kinase
MNVVAILLCAGHGTRMNDTRTHKVCYEIAGVPAIIRLVNNFKSAGIERFVVVVGRTVGTGYRIGTDSR